VCSSMMSRSVIKKRGSGLLAHITSLPSGYGIGDFGREAYRFADFLHQAKQSFWQTLPLNPTTFSLGNSPYDCFSAFAGNTLLISPEMLAAEGLLRKDALGSRPKFNPGSVNYRKAVAYKNRLFSAAYERFVEIKDNYDYESFCRVNSYWLDDYAIFAALHRHFGPKMFSEWAGSFGSKDVKASSLSGDIRTEVGKEKFLQFVFYKQWMSLKDYCNSRGIKIIGDIPIYVSYDSADVWAHPENYKLNKEGMPSCVSGVPPDIFSRTGQLWGNPIYDWEHLKKAGYRWWIERLRQNFRLFDIVRLDHFRGFVAYWEVPAKANTAKSGRWIDGPKDDFFTCILKQFPSGPIIVEDLGYITPDVREFISKYNLPCMKVLQFAFDGDSDNPYLPHNHIENCVVYTGTHDNNTVRGWFEKDAGKRQMKNLRRYLGRSISGKDIHRVFIRMAFGSVGKISIIPIQDVLGLDEQARMNHPARKRGNWRWQLKKEQLSSKAATWLAELTETYGRS